MLVLFALHADGQNSSNVFRIDEIPTNLLLNEGWEFKAGDNPEWSKQDLNDGGWSPIDPTLELHNLPQVKNAGIGWFRLKLQVDSSLMGESLTMVVSNIGASEIYLNGKLISRFGIVSPDYENEQTETGE